MTLDAAMKKMPLGLSHVRNLRERERRREKGTENNRQYDTMTMDQKAIEIIRGNDILQVLI